MQHSLGGRGCNIYLSECHVVRNGVVVIRHDASLLKVFFVETAIGGSALAMLDTFGGARTPVSTRLPGWITISKQSYLLTGERGAKCETFISTGAQKFLNKL